MTNTAQIIDRASLLASITPIITVVEVEDIGAVRIKQLSVAESDDARQRAAKDDDASTFGLALAAYALVDETGASLLDVTDLQPLRAAAGTKVDKLVQAVMVANGYKPKGAAAGN
jgi:hypothetical protein